MQKHFIKLPNGILFLTSIFTFLGPPPGSVFSFRPLSVSKSQLDLRPKSGILKNSNTNQSPNQTVPKAIQQSQQTQPPLPLTATMLMREAKEEIIRLEEIVAEQQYMLDSLLGSQQMGLEDDDEEERSHRSNTLVPTTSSTNHHISYQLTSTTTASASLTPGPQMSTMSLDPARPSSSSMLTNGIGPHSEQTGSSIDLWSKYQQLVMRQESTQKLSTDVRALIESLYKTLRDEKQTVAELRAKLSEKYELNLGKFQKQY